MERLELILPVIPPQIFAIKVSCLPTPEGIYTEHVPSAVQVPDWIFLCAELLLLAVQRKKY